MLRASITDDDGGERVLDPKNPADKKILDEGVKRLPDHVTLSGPKMSLVPL